MNTVAGRHRRSTPLIRLLERLGWQRDPALWTVPCRDPHGRRAGLLIRLWPSGITLTATADGPLYLTARETGWLWGASRDAINTCGLLTRTDPAESAPRTGAAPVPFEQPPTLREVVQIERPPRPTVSDLRARQAPGT